MSPAPASEGGVKRMGDRVDRLSLTSRSRTGSRVESVRADVAYITDRLSTLCRQRRPATLWLLTESGGVFQDLNVGGVWKDEVDGKGWLWMFDQDAVLRARRGA